MCVHVCQRYGEDKREFLDSVSGRGDQCLLVSQHTHTVAILKFYETRFYFKLFYTKVRYSLPVLLIFVTREHHL